MLHDTVRLLAFVFGALSFLGGLAALGVGGEVAASGVWGILFGSGIMIASVLQRSRYRSEAAERSHADPGPGGGEAEAMEPRFVPTTEVFLDPTTGRRMRVFVDPRTGERRYRAEG
jgi:hypothetical protein